MSALLMARRRLPLVVTQEAIAESIRGYLSVHAADIETETHVGAVMADGDCHRFVMYLRDGREFDIVVKERD
jgi:hypothetical protein